MAKCKALTASAAKGLRGSTSKGRRVGNETGGHEERKGVENLPGLNVPSGYIRHS